jgi:hypothetical protein
MWQNSNILRTMVKKSKIYSRRNEEQIKFQATLAAEKMCCPFAIHKQPIKHTKLCALSFIGNRERKAVTFLAVVCKCFKMPIDSIRGKETGINRRV